jgi:hypothetical protein
MSLRATGKMRVTGRPLPDYDIEPDLHVGVARQMGLRAVPELRQGWKVAGHELEVSWWQEHEILTILLLHDGWPAGLKPRKSLSLAEAFAAAVSNQLRFELGRVEHAVWKCRAMIEAGVVPPPSVAFPKLPDEAPQSEKDTWEAITSLALARWLPDDRAPGPMPLADAFLVGWAGTTRAVIRSGKRYLELDGLLRRSSKLGPESSWGKRLTMWDVALVPVGTPGAIEADVLSDRLSSPLIAVAKEEVV